MPNTKQNLIELMADFLDSDEMKLSEFKDPIERTKSELHIRMANAAYAEFERTVIPKENKTNYLPY